MDRLAMYHHLNSQVLWCQNNRESLLMIDPKMGAGSIYRKTLSQGVAVFGGKVKITQ